MYVVPLVLYASSPDIRRYIALVNCNRDCLTHCALICFSTGNSCKKGEAQNFPPVVFQLSIFIVDADIRNSGLTILEPNGDDLTGYGNWMGVG